MFLFIYFEIRPRLGVKIELADSFDVKVALIQGSPKENKKRASEERTLDEPVSKKAKSEKIDGYEHKIFTTEINLLII